MNDLSNKALAFLKNNKYKLISISVIVLVFQFLSSCMSFRSSDKKIYESFKNKKNKIAIYNYDTLGYNIRYAEVGDKNAPAIIFIHGAPGSLDAFIGFLGSEKLAKSAHLISVDRPGYGYSEFGKHEASIEKQALMLTPLLSRISQGEKAILIGHSYGGPIAARMAADHPDKIGGLIMVAPVLDPKNEKIFWFTHIAHAIRWLLPTSLRVASHEKINHAKELELLMPYWERISTPSTIIHGEKDGLAPFINVDFCKSVMTNAPLDVITKKDMSHFIPWENSNLIYDAIIKHLNSINSKAKK